MTGYRFPDLVPPDGGKSNSKQSSFESLILKRQLARSAALSGARIVQRREQLRFALGGGHHGHICQSCVKIRNPRSIGEAS